MVIDRIKKIIEYKEISTRQFCLKVGVANGFLDKVKDVGSEKLVKILYAFPDISPEWLLTGNGAMLRGQLAPEVAPPPSEPAFPGLIEEIKSLSVKVGRLEAENEHLRAAIEAKQREIEEGTREIDNKEREIEAQQKEIEAQQKEIEAKQREIERLQIENRLSHSGTTKKRAHEMANPAHESAVSPHSTPPTPSGLLNSQSQNTPSHL